MDWELPLLPELPDLRQGLPEGPSNTSPSSCQVFFDGVSWKLVGRLAVPNGRRSIGDGLGRYG